MEPIKRKKKRPASKPSRYFCWIVVGVETEKTDKKITYHSDDLLDFTKFLNREWKTWKLWIVYDNRVPKGEKGPELARFTPDKPPTKKWL